MKAWAGHLLAMACVTLASAPVAAKPSTRVDPMDPGVWEIGPITSKGNYSVNMPLSPSAHPTGGWFFDIPNPTAAAGHVHYVTFKHGSLSGKSRIILRYRVEMAEGVQIVPTDEEPNTYQSMLTIYFQRRGDDWSGRGKFEAYRWWASFNIQMPIKAGPNVVEVPLDGSWTAVVSSTATNNPKAFRDAIREAERVGFTFGGGDGLGHGVYATGAARFVVTGFEVVGDTDFGIRSAPVSAED